MNEHSNERFKANPVAVDNESSRGVTGVSSDDNTWSGKPDNVCSGILSDTFYRLGADIILHVS